MNNDLRNHNDLTDAELITLVQNRDEAAFAELISRWTPRIWRIVVSKSLAYRCLKIKATQGRGRNSD